MEIRPYQLTDRDACIDLFSSNRQAFFPETELVILTNALDDPASTTYVAEHEGRIIGGGGYVGTRISWLIVHPQIQRQGIGRFLALYLLREVGRTQSAQTISLKTIPATSAFFEKLGFRPVSINPDGIEMIKKMDVCA